MGASREGRMGEKSEVDKRSTFSKLYPPLVLKRINVSAV